MSDQILSNIIDYKFLTNLIPALIWMSDTNKSCYFFNDVWLNFTGRTLEQEKGDGWSEGVHPEDLEKCINTYVSKFDKRENFTIEYRLKRHDGQYRWILDSGIPMYHPATGIFLGYVGTCFDITEKIELESFLQKSHENYKKLFKKHISIMLLVDPVNGSIVDANDAAICFYGYSYEQICSMNIAEINMLSQKEIFEDMAKAKLLNEFEFYFPHKLSNNQTKYVQVNSSPIEFNQKIVLFSVIQDVTEKIRIEKELKYSHQKTNALINTTKDYIFSLDTNFNVTATNNAFLEFIQPFAKKKPFIVGNNILTDLDTDESFVDKRLNFYNRSLNGESFSIEDHLLIPKHNFDRWHELTLHPIYQESVITGVAVYIKDISENKLTEINLRQEKDNFQSIVKALPDIVIKIDAAFRFSYIHTLTPEILYKPVHEMMGKKIYEIFDSGFSETVLQKIQETKNTDEYVIWDHMLEIPKKGLRYFEGRLVKAINQSTLLLIRDITESKNKENELKLANERFDYATKATSDGIYEWDIVNDKTYWSNGYKELFEYTVPNNIGDYSFWYNKLDITYKEQVLKSLHKAIEGNETKWQEEYKFRKGNGDYIDVIDRAIIIRNEAGKAIKLVGALSDISAKKKQEHENKRLEQEKLILQTIEKSERRYSQLVNSIHDILFTTDNNGNWIFLNHSWETTMEYSVAECLGVPFFNYLHKEDVEKNTALFVPLIERKKDYCKHNIRYVTKTGKIVWMEVFAVLIINEKNETIGTSGTLRDITKEKKEEHYYNLLSKNTRELVCVHNQDSTLAFISDSVKDILQFEVDEITGENLENFIHPEDKHFMSEVIAERKLDKTNNYKREIIARYKRKDGTYTWLESDLNVIFDEYSYEYKLVSTSKVIDNRIKEEQKIREALKNEQKLNDLKTRFISTASHEFKTPLTVIKSTIEVLNQYIIRGKPIKDLSNSFTIINKEIDALTRLLNDILLLEKIGSNKINYNPVLSDIITIIQLSVDKINASQNDGRVAKIIHSGNNRLLHTDVQLMDIVFTNLLSNAFKYSIGKPSPTIKINLRLKNVIITIRDYGIGIPETDLSKIFNSFFRATNVGEIEGTGLGLSIVKDLIEIHYGKIRFKSIENTGTEFQIILPRQNLIH